MFTFDTALTAANDQLYVRYTPVLKESGPCFSGQLTFSSWDVPVGNPQAEHDEAKAKALANARQVLATILDTSL